MVHVNTRTFRWMMGAFCAALGTLMLIAPHQYAAPLYTGLQPLLPVWGSLLLVAGGGLLLAAGIFVRQALIISALLLAAVIVGAFATVFVAARGIDSITMYGTVTVGLVLAMLAPKSAALRPDLFALTIAANHVLTGAAMLFTTSQYQAPFYTGLSFPVAWLGAMFLLGGSALLFAQVLAVRSGLVLGLLHAIGGLPMLLFVGLIAIPLRVWPDILYYGGLGLAVLLLPWLAVRLNHVTVSSLRVRLALAFTALTVLPLVATLTFVTNREESLALDQALNEQHLLALTFATSVDEDLGVNSDPTPMLQRMLSAQPIEHDTRIVVLDATNREVAKFERMTRLTDTLQLAPPYALLAADQAVGELQYSTPDGVWLAGFAPVAAHNWLVVVTRPAVSALSRVRIGREDIFVILGVVAMVAAGFGVLTARWLTQPLRDLTTAAQALAENNSAPRLPQTDVAEIDRLTAAFGTMRERLHARTTERDWADAQRMQLLEQEHNARLAAEQAAARTMRLQSVTAALAQSLTSAQIAQAVTEEAVAALGAVAGLATLRTPDGAMLEVIGWAGYAPEVSRGWERFPVSAEVPLSEAVRTGKSIFLESAEERTRRFPGLPTPQGTNRTVATAALPLIINDEAVGAIGFSMVEYRIISADERTFMETLARLCAQALDRAQLFEAERTARAQAEAAVQLRETFLSVASHELKTPLTSLHGHAELLERRTNKLGEEGDRTRRSVLVILEQSRRLNRLIATLLDVSRIRSGKLEIEQHIVDFGALIQQVTGELAPLLVNHTLRFVMPARLITVLGDPLRLEQVVYNLLNNAVKYSPAGGSIEISLSDVDAQAVFSVSDQGLGIPVNALPYLFTPFYRAENVNGGGISGMGIGLHVVREIVTLHGGQVRVTSQEGHGSTFTVVLPLHAASTAMRVRAVEPPLAVTLPEC